MSVGDRHTPRTVKELKDILATIPDNAELCLHGVVLRETTHQLCYLIDASRPVLVFDSTKAVVQALNNAIREVEDLI